MYLILKQVQMRAWKEYSHRNLSYYILLCSIIDRLENYIFFVVSHHYELQPMAFYIALISLAATYYLCKRFLTQHWFNSLHLPTEHSG